MYFGERVRRGRYLHEQRRSPGRGDPHSRFRIVVVADSGALPPNSAAYTWTGLFSVIARRSDLVRQSGLSMAAAAHRRWSTLSGGSWSGSGMLTQDPEGDVSSELDQVSCSAVGSCFAYGSRTDANGTFACLPALRTEVKSLLTSVAPPVRVRPTCSSARSVAVDKVCAAVGDFQNSSTGAITSLVATLQPNGSWIATAPAVPLDASANRYAELVLGRLRHQCQLHRRRFVSNEHGGLGAADRHVFTVGREITAIVPSLPVGADTSATQHTFPYRVSCPTASDCSAVGEFTQAAGDQNSLFETLGWVSQAP